ncbi:unnamed protein product [Polarella glacialis]|uniref:Uncharacterized protein n=1 Tax=Polarella glacialis TaxID=89957 RepID=A0A813LZ47_POLGL|nr:unnamed protein product [Polarella glacialis]
MASAESIWCRPATALRPDVVRQLEGYFAERQCSASFARALVNSTIRRRVPFLGIGVVTAAEADEAWRRIEGRQAERASQAFQQNCLLRVHVEKEVALLAVPTPLGSPCVRRGVWRSRVGSYELSELADGRIRYVEVIPDGRSLCGLLVPPTCQAGWWEADVHIAYSAGQCSRAEPAGSLRLRCVQASSSREASNCPVEGISVVGQATGSCQAISQVLPLGDLDWCRSDLVLATLADGVAPRRLLSESQLRQWHAK